MLSTIAIIHDNFLFINRVYTSTRPTTSQNDFFSIVTLRIKIALGNDAHIAALSFGCNLLLPITLNNPARHFLISLLYQPSESTPCCFQGFYGSGGSVGGVVFADAVFGGKWRRLV